MKRHSSFWWHSGNFILSRLGTGLFLLPLGCLAAPGGTCPSAANYLNATTMQLVTLSSLGVTSCYYVAANGSDSNDGLSEASGHPWAHAPGMSTCSGNCATVQNTFNGPPAGTGFIFRGGDTWHFGNSGASPYTGGEWATANGLNGTLAHPYYIGVDQSWYTGASWARPILTADNFTSASTTLGPCAYHSGSNNNMVGFSGASHFIFDNFEMTGFCQDSTGAPNGKDHYINYGSSGDMRFLNLYIHGWTHQQFYSSNPIDCGPGETGICFNISVFRGGNEPNTPDDVFRYVVIDGSDSDPRAAEACYCDFWDVAYSYIGNQANVITRYHHLYHDNLYEYWYENGHGNVIESVGDAPGTNAMYNSVFRHINVPNDAGDPFIWMLPNTSTTDYFFNLLIYDVGTMEYFIVGNNNANQGSYVVFNSVFQANPPNPANIGCSATGNSASLTVANMLYITDNLPVITSNCSPWIQSNVTSVTMTNSAATAAGYVSSGTYAYSTPAASSPTVGKGTNERTTFCNALSSAGLSDAAAACQSDTTYACAYNRTNHTITCPQRTPLARASSGAWDVGAFNYSAGQNPPAAAPTGLTSSVR